MGAPHGDIGATALASARLSFVHLKKSCTSGLFWDLPSNNMEVSDFRPDDISYHRYSRF
jgi:hypothetical protein